MLYVSLNISLITQRHSRLFDMTPELRMRKSLLVCLYLVPFPRFSVNNGVTLKSEFGVIQSHRRWHHSTDHIRVPISVPL